MTDLTIGVRLKADGSGLVGTVREAKAEVGALGTAAASAGTQAKQLAAGADVAERSMRDLATAEAAVGQSTQSLIGDQRQAQAALGATSVAIGRTTRAINDNEQASRRHAAGARNLGQQFGDFGLQAQATGDPIRSLTQQLGQMGYAASEMGGRIGKVGAFLTGPWGIALTVATAFALPLIQSLFDTETALEKVELGANAVGNAQSVLGQMFDLSTGKIKENSEALILNARAQAINMRAEAARLGKSSAEAFLAAGKPSSSSLAAGGLLALSGNAALAPGLIGGNTQVRTLARQARDASRIQDERQRTDRLDQILRISEDVDFKGSSITRAQFQQAIIDGAASRANAAVADLIDKSLDDGKLAEGLRRNAKAKKPPKPKSTAAVDEFGRDTKDRIASILSQFDDTPPAVRAVDGAVRQLNDLIDDLNRKKPPNFKELIADAERAKTVVRDGINKPFDDFLDSQDEQLRIQQLLLVGRQDEAAALRIINQLERQRGPLTSAQKTEVLATVQGLRLQERQLQRLYDRQRAYLGAVEDVRAIIAQTVFEGPESIAKLPERIFASFKQLSADVIVDRLFGDVFDQLRAQIDGTDKVQAASVRMSGAMDGTVLGLNQLTAAAKSAAGALVDQADDVVVTGKRDPGKDLTPKGLFGDTVGQLLKKVGVDDEKADKIGKAAGKGLQGAFEGQAASGILSLFGVKQSSTGSAIGGALGAMTGIPGGSIIGGILGGSIGSLLAPKAKPGGVTVGGVNGQAGRTGTSGSDRAAIGAAGGLGDRVAAGINRIAEQLGGKVGAFNVSIGKYKDDLRVNENGKALGGVKGSGAYGFGDDADAAVAKAIQLAIAQGGVQGLSNAVAQALRSSPDIDQALKEALKVADLEKMLGGITGQLQSIFKDFDATAAERVTLARKYGLDLLQIEKINAEQRADLLDKTLRDRVGSLQDLMKDLQYGDLFEGTAAERRSKLLAEYAEAEKDADAGVAGAAERLAEIARALVSTSKEAFGTAGPEYASDRERAAASAQRIIELETKRVADAAAATKAQIDSIAGNSAVVDENSALTAANTARMEDLTAAIERLMAAGGGIDTALTARAAV